MRLPVPMFGPVLAVLLAAGCATTKVAVSDLTAADVKALTAFDYAEWTFITTTYVNDKGAVDYPKLLADRARLDRFVALLALVGPTTRPELFASAEQKLAYYINAYNALTMFNVVNRYPTIQQVVDNQLSFFVTTKFKLDGAETNLYDLENKTVRPTFQDSRVHFALNCASGGCPVLPNEPFLPETLQAQLDRERTEFLHESRNVAVENGKVVLSNIFDWYKDDFGPDPVAWIRTQAPDLNLPETKDYEIRPYDWALNDSTRVK